MEKTEKKTKKKFWNFNIVVFLSILLFAMTVAPKTLQNDTFYTIKVGEYIFQNGIFNLTEDTFSWHELPYTYPHWLYDLGIYLIYNTFGHFGIYLSTIIFTAILGLTIYLSSSKFSKNKIVSFVITILTMYLLKPYLAARAQLVTFILFSLTVYFIEMFLETHKKRYAVGLIIIPILITNLHCAVFPFYFILYLPYIAEYLLITLIDLDLDYKIIKGILKLEKKLPVKQEVKDKCDEKIARIPEIIEKKKAKREEKRQNPYRIKVEKNPFVKWLIVVMIIALFTGFINPTGTGAYTYTYKTYQGNTTDSINEHIPLPLISTKEFLCALCMFLAILVFTDTKIKLSDLFMLGGLIALALMSRRQISMFAIFGAPILAKLISAFFEKYDKKTCSQLLELASTVIGGLIIILIFANYSVIKLDDMKYQDYVKEQEYPIKAAEWIKKNLDVQNIKLYNEYNYGSYLLFQDIPVFIDSRCDLYTPEFNEDKKNNIEGRDIFSDALDISGLNTSYNREFERYGVTHAILPVDSKLVTILKYDENYKQIYKDDFFAIYEKL